MKGAILALDQAKRQLTREWLVPRDEALDTGRDLAQLQIGQVPLTRRKVPFPHRKISAVYCPVPGGYPIWNRLIFFQYTCLRTSGSGP
jgi:hypothetical protein